MVSAQTQSGFTLIELILVSALIGILTSVLIVAINVPGQFAKVRDAQRKNDLSNLQKILELYYNDKNNYPGLLSEMGSSYIRSTPQDPKPSQTYAYTQKLSGQGYGLYAALERCQPGKCFDNQACDPINGNACAGSLGLSCGATCTYGVASSNLSP